MDLWVKAAHIISVISWMAVLLYLPRLFVYHCEAEQGGIQSETFKVMEQRLLKAIGTPAMLLTWVFGLWVASLYNVWSQPWFLTKLLFVVGMTILHFVYASYAKSFKEDRNQHSQRFYRIMNEAPAVLMLFIVILVVVKPF